MRVTEVEDKLTNKENMLDKLRREYNDLMEKHLKTPKKVTTTSTTVKTIVDQDPTDIEIPKIEDKPMGKNQYV